jgi:hypothetical protein
MGSVTAMMVIRFATRAALLMILAMLVVAGISRFNQQPITLDTTFTQAFTAPLFIVGIRNSVAATYPFDYVPFGG